MKSWEKNSLSTDDVIYSERRHSEPYWLMPNGKFVHPPEGFGDGKEHWGIYPYIFNDFSNHEKIQEISSDPCFKTKQPGKNCDNNLMVDIIRFMEEEVNAIRIREGENFNIELNTGMNVSKEQKEALKDLWCYGRSHSIYLDVVKKGAKSFHWQKEYDFSNDIGPMNKEIESCEYQIDKIVQTFEENKNKQNIIELMKADLAYHKTYHTMDELKEAKQRSEHLLSFHVGTKKTHHAML